MQRHAVRTKGFTLVELLIVIAIIGILASIVLVSLSSARVRALNAKNLAALSSINTALQMYWADNGKYPYTWGGWAGSCSTNGAPPSSSWIPGLSGLPIDARNNGTCHEGWSQFIYLSDGVDYKLISHASASMEVPNNLKDLVRPSWAWGYWTPGAA